MKVCKTSYIGSTPILASHCGKKRFPVGLISLSLMVRFHLPQLYMVAMVLMVSTSDCGSDGMGSNPISYPK